MPVSSFPVCFVLQDDGPTARDLLVQYATGKKGSKNKKKLEKAMKVLKVRLCLRMQRQS